MLRGCGAFWRCALPAVPQTLTPPPSRPPPDLPSNVPYTWSSQCSDEGHERSLRLLILRTGINHRRGLEQCYTTHLVNRVAAAAAAPAPSLLKSSRSIMALRLALETENCSRRKISAPLIYKQSCWNCAHQAAVLCESGVNAIQNDNLSLVAQTHIATNDLNQHERYERSVTYILTLLYMYIWYSHHRQASRLHNYSIIFE